MPRLCIFLLLLFFLPSIALARGHGGWSGGRSGGHSSHAYRAPRAYAPTHVRMPHSRPSSALPRSRPNNSYREYRREVDRLSNKNYRAHRSEIDPAHLRGKRAHHDLDHIKPVKRCYEQGMSPETCANTGNLRVLDAHQNRSEGCRGCKK